MSPITPTRLGTTLLSRDAFRTGVFLRDGNRCVVCGGPGVDAHHIMERRLFPDGGYRLDNGATLCPDCHLGAEQTTISCETVRQGAGITTVILPPHLDPEDTYDKWGNLILPTGARLRGELFSDESVQRVLKAGGVLSLFVPYVKYPRTPHFKWSEGAAPDDIVWDTADRYTGVEVVVTPKYDGESTSCYRDRVHARSVDGASHPSQAWVRRDHARWGYELPEGWRLCGENLFAAHTYHYRHLPDFFLAYSVWTESNRCLDWDSTVEWCTLLGVTPVPVLYRGIWDERLVRGLMRPTYRGDPMEGLVVRPAAGFEYGAFRHSVAKAVSADFKAAFRLRAHDQGKRRVVVPNIVAEPSE